MADKETRRQKPARQPKKIRTMDVILVVIVILLVTFTITMIKIFRETGTIPDTLCTCVFTALGGECGAMAWIKTTKERKRDRNWELEDRNHNEQLQKEAETKEDNYEP